MSNDDGFAPPPPEDTSESGLGGLADGPSADDTPGAGEPPRQSGADPLDPTQAMPPDGADRPETSPPDSTRVMPTEPVTPPTNPVQSGEGIPPIVPGAAAGAATPPPSDGVPLEEDFDDEPWYKNPRVIAGIVLGLVVVGLIILLFVLLGDDDDEGGIDDLSSDPVTLVVVRTNSGGGALSTSLSATVMTPTPSPDDYRWIAPADGVVGSSVVVPADATGRVEFRWGPVEVTEDWASTVDLVEAVEPEGDQQVTGIGANCELDRDGSTEPLVVATDVSFDESGDSLTGVGRYNFPNITFRPGDRVTCAMVNQLASAPPTTVAETTTTVAETTTTVAETTTTAAPTTAAPTTAAPTTAAPTTAAPTTAAPTTVPAPPTVINYLTDNGFERFRDLLIQANVLSEIEQSGQPFTLFVPTNQAVDAFLNSFDPTATNLDDVVRSHLSFVGALDRDDLAGRNDIDVDFGGAQPLNFGPTPPTIGAAPDIADIVEFDQSVEESAPGVLFIIDAVLAPQP